MKQVLLIFLSLNAASAFAQEDTNFSIHGFPAHRVKNLLFVSSGKAINWNEAKAQCDKVTPSGKWRLPNATEMMMDLMIGSSEAGIQIPHAEGKTYPYWIQDEDPKKNHLIFEGTSLFALVSDGTGTDVQYEKLEEIAAQFDKMADDASSEASTLPADKQKESEKLVEEIRSFIKEFSKTGFTVFCVAEEKEVQEKSVSPEAVSSTDNRETVNEPTQQSAVIENATAHQLK